MKVATKRPSWGRFLAELIRLTEATSGLELGTNVGISGSYMARALRRNGGQLTTIEGVPDIAKIAAETFRQLDLSAAVTVAEGRFIDVLPDLLRQSSHVDLAFIDGHHEGKATLQYFHTIRSAVPPGGVMVFDDINWSEDMNDAWRKISEDGGTGLAVTLGSVGVWVSA